MIEAVRPWALALKNLVFPIYCRECGVQLLTDENGYFCPTCWERSPKIVRPFCSVCGRPQPARLGFGPAPPNFPCDKCRIRKDPTYRRIYGAGVYTGAVAEAIKLLKFNGKVQLAAPLAERMAEFAEQEIDLDAYDAIVPVPLHRVRLRERGFNQSQLLAEYLVPAFAGARLDASLRRIRPTKVQSRLKSEVERRKNVVGAFAVDAGTDFAGQNVLLVDDVVTSGGTVSECSRALIRAGAQFVDVFAAALPA